MARRKRSYGLVDPPSRFATLDTWERHLAELKKLPADAVLKPQMIKTAQEAIERKRTARTVA